MRNTMIRFLSICMITLMLGSMFGCAAQEKPAATQPPTEQETVSGIPTEESTEPSESTTRMITDVLGREVEIPAVINTVDCHGSAARMMVYAGAAEKIAGVTECEMCKDTSIGTVASGPHAYTNHDRFMSCTATSSGWPKFETYYEEIVTLDPDVIVIFGADAAACDEMQNKVGIPVVGIYATDILADDFKQTLTLLGDIMGTQEQANKVVAGLEGYLKDLNDRTASIPEEDRPTVYAGAVSFKGYNGFDGTYANFPIFRAINAKNVVDETGGNGAMFVDLEKLTVWDPDYVFLNSEPQSLAIVNEKYAADPAFYDTLSAVKNGTVYTLAPFNWYYTNMEIALVDAYWVACTIYPEQFADVNFEEKANEIFNLFVGCDYIQVLEDAGMGFAQYQIGK